MTSLPIAAGLDETLAQETPANRGKFVPWRRENRMVSILIVAILLLALMGILGARGILRYPTANSTPAWVFLSGCILLALKILLGMLQTEFARRDSRLALEEAQAVIARHVEDARKAVDQTRKEMLLDASKTRHDLKNDLNATKLEVHELAMKANGGLTAAVKEVGEQVRAAEKDQAALDLIDRAEFKALMQSICQTTSEAAAEKAIQKFRDEMKGQ